jgi:hypothetical protein
MKRLTPLLIALSLFALPATGFAQGSFDGEQDETQESSDKIGITGTVHAGPSLFFGGGGPVQGGFHLDLYPGYEVVDDLSVELNLGFRLNVGGAANSALIPVLVPGVRYQFDVGDSLKPYVHGHLGLAINSFSGATTNIPGFGSFSTGGGSTAVFTFNYGGGLNYWFNDTVAFSGGLTVRHYAGSGFLTSLGVNLGTALKF